VIIRYSERGNTKWSEKGRSCCSVST